MVQYLINILKVVLLGIVEGITEWLPISSTGHMIILEQWLNLEGEFGADFWNLFLVVIQLGAIIAVFISFIKKIWPFGENKTKEEKKKTWLVILNVCIACVPAGIVGILLDDWIDSHIMNFITVSVTLIVYGIAFIVIEYLFKRNRNEFKVNDVYMMTWKTALIIGCAQVLSLVPGTSRSGVTILAAMLIGCDRKTSAEFSFLVSIPVMFGASLFKGAKYAMSGASLTDVEGSLLLIGCIVAFVVSLLTIKYFMKFIKNNTFTGFGYYRIALGIVLVTYFCITTYMNQTSLAYETMNLISRVHFASLRPVLL